MFSRTRVSKLAFIKVAYLLCTLKLSKKNHLTEELLNFIHTIKLQKRKVLNVI